MVAEAAALLPPSRTFHPLQPPLHLSLAHPFPLLSHQLQPFVASLTRRLSPLSGGPVLLSGLRVYRNEAGLRSFAAVGVEDEAAVLRTVGGAVVEALREWGVAVLWEARPSWHVTFAWAGGDVLGGGADETGPAATAAARVESSEGPTGGGAQQGDGEGTREAEENSGGAADRDTSLDRATQQSVVVQVRAVHVRTGDRVQVIPLRLSGIERPVRSCRVPFVVARCPSLASLPRSSPLFPSHVLPALLAPP